MREVTIQDYIGRQKELTAEQVKKLPVGTTVRYHSFDRWGSHQTLDMTVVAYGKRKVLRASDWRGYPIEKPIRKTTDRYTYTEVEENGIY